MNHDIIKAQNEGPLTIGDINLSVAVLEDGTRVISHAAIFKAFGRTKRGRPIDGVRVVSRPSFIDAKNLQPLIDAELDGYLQTISYQTIDGKEATGYNALILPKLCKVYLDARAEKNPETNKPYIDRKQEPLARMSEILLFALSKVGIIALVDEATGYQYEREKTELQAILKAYVAEEILDWQLTFNNSFYQEIFRLRKWNFTPGDIRRRPGIVGIYTVKYIYNMLPPNVFNTIKARTPRSAAGNATARYFQFLTPETGYEHLKHQIITVTALMSVARNWSEFEDLFARRFGQRALDFDEKEADIKDVQISGSISSLGAHPTQVINSQLKLYEDDKTDSKTKRKKKVNPKD